MFLNQIVMKILVKDFEKRLINLISRLSYSVTTETFIRPDL